MASTMASLMSSMVYRDYTNSHDLSELKELLETASETLLSWVFVTCQGPTYYTSRLKPSIGQLQTKQFVTDPATCTYLDLDIHDKEDWEFCKGLVNDYQGLQRIKKLM